MDIPKKQPNQVLTAAEVNELAARASAPVDAPMGMADPTTLAIGASPRTGFDLDCLAGENLQPYAVSHVTAVTGMANGVPRATCRSLVAGTMPTLPLIMVTNGMSAVTSGGRFHGTVLRDGGVYVLRYNSAKPPSIGQVCGVAYGSTLVSAGQVGMVCLSAVDSTTGTVVVLVRNEDLLLKTSEEIPARDDTTLGVGEAIVCRRDGDQIVETEEIVEVYNTQEGEPIAEDWYIQAKIWQGVPVADVVQCGDE